MGSERLPGKVLAPLCGIPALRHVIDRVSAASMLAGAIVATTTSTRDDAVCDCAATAGVAVYRGSETDVMRRMLEAARSAGAATIVRVTGDCPLIDPAIVDAVVEKFIQLEPDYACNFLDGHQYPRGQEVEVFGTDTLALLEAERSQPRDREHVTTSFYEHPERFRLIGVTAPESQRRPELRLTLDTREDYALISAIYDELFGSDPLFGLSPVLDLLARRPELVSLNTHIRQKAP